MASNQKGRNWLCLESCERFVSEFTDLDEVGAKFLYTDILKAVKENTWDDKIDCLRNLSFVLRQVSKIKTPECLRNYQHPGEIGHFNLVSLACKNKAIKVLEYLFSEETQTFYNLSIQVSEFHENESLLSVKDEFSHNAFYYAVRSNMTDLLRILIDKSKSLHNDEGLDDLLSKSYKELKLRNISLTKDMQLFIQSKILELRFFHASKDKNNLTGNSWEQIKLRTEQVIRFIRSIKKDYWNQDPDEKFIFILEFISKNIHILKYVLKSTYDKIPWEEMEFCLVVFIRCCKNSSELNLEYNSVLNKKRLLEHLINFSDVLETQSKKLKNKNVRNLAKSIPNSKKRDEIMNEILQNNGQFRDLYADYTHMRDFCSLKIIKRYTDLIQPNDIPVERRCFIIFRVLQVMGEHLKNTLDSPKLSTSTANALLCSLSPKTREFITKLRDSISHEESLFIRSEIEKKKYLFKNIEKDILKIKAVIPDILSKLRASSVNFMIEKIKACDSVEDIKGCCGPYRQSFFLFSEEIEQIHSDTPMKGDFEHLAELLTCLDKSISDKTSFEKMLFDQIYLVIEKNKETLENQNQQFYYTAQMASVLNRVLYGEYMNKDFTYLLNDKFTNISSKFFLYKSSSENFKHMMKVLDLLLQKLMQRILPSKNREVIDILARFLRFFKSEMGSLKWIDEINMICRNVTSPNLRYDLYENLFIAKSLQLKDVLKDFDLMDSTSSADISSFEKNMELQAATEMLILDMLCILENSCSRNPFFLDSAFPFMSGKNLRNHLAHGNILIDVCLEESSSQILLNAKTILTTILSKNNNKLDKVIKCDCFKLESSIEHDLKIIDNQQKLFSALEKGNMKEVEENVSEGADVYGKDGNLSTSLHFAAKASDITALKWVLKQGLNTDSSDSTGQSVLHIAAKFNRLEIVQYLIEQKHMTFDACDSNKKTPLHVAIENQSNDVVKYILTCEINTSKKDKNGLSPLHTAIYWNNIQAAHLLIDKEPNVDENKSHGYLTALHVATLRNNLKLVELLLIEKKASVDAETDFGQTPLMLAVNAQHLEIVKTLVLHGSDVNKKNVIGITPLHAAVHVGNLEIVDLLFQHGADIHDPDFRKISPLMSAAGGGYLSVARFLLQKGALVNSTNDSGYTPLHCAASGGHCEIVELLLNHKATIDCKDKSKCTPLHLGAFAGHKKVIRLLLKEGADINAVFSEDATLLQTVVLFGYKDIVDILIDSGAEINSKNHKGLTALHLAALSGDRDIIEILLKKGADTRAVATVDLTPMSLLISGGHWDLLSIKDKDVKTSDGFGYTPLHLSALHGDQKLVEYCINNGCEINARCKSGATALHLAAQGNYAKIVDLLLNKGAKMDLKDNGGNEALLVATLYNCKDVVQVLISHDTSQFKSVTIDKIVALKISVNYGFCDIVDILLENYKIDFSKEQEKAFLKTAVSNNHKYVVATLLERGFEINGEAKPLHVAVYHRHYDMTEFLLSKGANPNVLDSDNCTPLDIAVKLADSDMIEVLLSAESDKFTEKRFILKAVESGVRANQLDIVKLLLKMAVIKANATGNNGFTLLHTSALAGSLDVAKYLIAQGADINAKNKNDNKPVHIAAEKGFLDMVDFFLNCPDSEVETVSLLLVAARNGKANVCELILAQILDVNAIHSKEATPLQIALENDHEEVFMVLLHYGAYYNVQPLLEITGENTTRSVVEGLTGAVKKLVPEVVSQIWNQVGCLLKTFGRQEKCKFILTKVENLFRAVQNNSCSEVEALLEDGANFKFCFANAKCVKMEAVLHYASWKGYEKIVDILLKYNANPNARTKTGDTPLHYAVKFSHFNITKALLSKGAMYNALSVSEKAPIDMAADQNIRDFLIFINDIFTRVENKDTSVLKHLIGKEESVLQAVVRAKNQERKTLMDVAYMYDFPETDQLEMVFDPNHELSLAIKFLLEGKYYETNLAFESALEKRTTIFGADSQPVLDVKSLMANKFLYLYDFEKAERFILEVYESRKSILGEDNLKTLLDKILVAVVLKKNGKREEALQILETIYFKLKDKQESENEGLLNGELELSTMLLDMKKFDEVLEICNKIKKNLAHKKEDHYRLILAEFSVIKANVLAHREMYPEALIIYQEIYDLAKSILMPYSSNILRKALLGIVTMCFLQEKYDECLELCKSFLDILKPLVPEDHKDILEIKHLIGRILFIQESFVSALKIFLSLQPKIAAVAPDSGLMNSNTFYIESLKKDFSDCVDCECLLDKI